MSGYNNCTVYEIISVKKKKKRKKYISKQKTTKFYWFLEKNVKSFLENEDDVLMLNAFALIDR